eukprot:6514445-Ditylum_brightwellii.AAC.1
MSHKQPETTIVTDNNTVHRFTQGTMIPKQSKAMDMQLHWLKCCLVQNQFKIKWKRGSVNKADYHSKHHHPQVHQKMRPCYVINAMWQQQAVPQVDMIAKFISSINKLEELCLRGP